MPKVCIVPSCRTNPTVTDGKRSFFRVPHDRETRKKWNAAIPGITILSPKQCVCEKHFEPNCIVRAIKQHGNTACDIPSRRPRLISSAVPTIFEEAVTATMETTNHRPYLSLPLASLEFVDVDALTEESMITESEHKANNHQLTGSAVIDQFIPKKTVYAPTKIGPLNGESNVMNEAEKTNTVQNPLDMEPSCNNEIFKFSVMNTQVQFGNSGSATTVSLPKPWSAVESSTVPKQMFINQINSNSGRNDGGPVILKSIVIDKQKSIRYYVLGMLVKQSVSQLPQTLNEPTNLIKILSEFHRMRVCTGLGDADVHFTQTHNVEKDNLRLNRSSKCMLVGSSRTCWFCSRLRKTLLQKKFRDTQRGTNKRVMPLSNPLDQKKLDAMRNKVMNERRAKNRLAQKVKLLMESLKESQNQFGEVTVYGPWSIQNTS